MQITGKEAMKKRWPHEYGDFSLLFYSLHLTVAERNIVTIADVVLSSFFVTKNQEL